MPLLNYHIVSEQCSWGIWHLSESEDELLKLLPRHTDKAELERIPHLTKKIEWLGARVLLSNLLKAQNPHFEKDSKKSWLTKDENGKPQLNHVEGYISIAHCKKFAVAIWHKLLPCGIDIEQINPKIQRVAHRVYSAKEIAWAGNDLDRLSTLWCSKEALYKYYGRRKLDFKNEIQIIENQDNKIQESNTLLGNIVKDNRQMQARIFTTTFGNYKIAYCF